MTSFAWDADYGANLRQVAREQAHRTRGAVGYFQGLRLLTAGCATLNYA